MQDSAIAMAKRLLVDSIWKSANLEGLGTTFPKTEAILENVPTNTSTEEVLFVVNMKRAWQFLLDNLEYPTSIALLCEFNKLAGNMLFQYAGKIRTIPVQIGGATWEPEMPDIETIIDTLGEINAINDIEERALKHFCYAARTQMFINGNKRVAQLVANKVLIEHNIGIFQIPIDKIDDLKTLLIDYYERGKDENIIAFMKEYCIKRVRKSKGTITE